MDKVAVDQIRDFEEGLRRHVAERYGDLLDHLEQTGEIADEGRLKEAITSFTESFEAKKQS
jgi:F0F1-type ATP synthase alpha subunit